MIIHPEVIVTPDCPTVRFRESKAQVDLDIEIPRILHSQGWGCGTYFNVQFMNHEKTKLLSSATFVVSERQEVSHTNESNPYQPMTKTLSKRKAEIIGDWISFGEEEKPKKETNQAQIHWNPGKKVHQLKIDDEVIYENADKEQVLKVAGA